MSKLGSKKVGVIIPTYNGLPYLEESVKSVLNQTYRNLTLYVVDDGSTDQTADYIKRIKDPRLRYLPKKNGGPSSARNYGIRHSKEPFIAFLDADDFWYPRKLERQMALMEKKPALGMIYGFQRTINEKGQVIGSLEYGNRGWIFDKLLAGNFVTGSSSMVVIRREVFRKTGFFREDLRIGEDWEMWLRIAKSFEVDFVPEYLAAIRIRAGGAQRNYMRVGDGLRYILPVVLGEFKLSLRQRNRVILGTLLDAALNYRAARAYKTSVLTLLELFCRNPGALFLFRKWPAYISVLFGIDISLIVKKRVRRIRDFLGIKRFR